MTENLTCEHCEDTNPTVVTQTVRWTEDRYEQITICQNRVDCWERWDQSQTRSED